MADSNISRRVLDSTFPSGPIWEVEIGGDLDKFYAAMALNFEYMREKAVAVGSLRNPWTTPSLSDLEIEFGVLPDPSLSEASRRAYLAAVMGEKCVLPSWLALENKLRAAGFNVRVFPNEPAVDPGAILVGYDGYWLVNGNVLSYQERDYDVTVCKTSTDIGESTVCDDDGSEDVPDRGDTVSSFTGMLRYQYEYKSPLRYRWPLTFFIAASKESGEWFTDWNMEHATTTLWTPGGGAALEKSLLWKTSGIRSLEVQAAPAWSDPIGPHAERMRATADIITGTRTIVVQVSASTGVRAGFCVCDKDGVWDVAGMKFSAVGSAGEQLLYNANNGISGVRLYIADGGIGIKTGDRAFFDDLRIMDLGFVKASIPENLRLRFERLVLRYKPLRTWAGILIDWTPVVPPAPGPHEEDD